MTPTLTVSIVSHGHADLLPSLLGDVRRFAPTAQIIVTCNIPEPDFDLAAWPSVEFRQNERPKGFGANHNAALRSATTEWLAIVNPDIRLEATTMDRLFQAIRRSPEIALLAPAVVDPQGNPQDSRRSLPTPARVFLRAVSRLRGRTPPPEPADAASWFAGMFLLVRRTAFAAVGGFDERFFMYGEDVALSVRLVERGYRLRAVDDAVVVHDARRATLRSFRHLRWHVASLLCLWTMPAFYRHERSMARSVR